MFEDAAFAFRGLRVKGRSPVSQKFQRFRLNRMMQKFLEKRVSLKNRQ